MTAFKWPGSAPSSESWADHAPCRRNRKIAPRQAEVDAAWGQLWETHKRLARGEPTLQAELADGVNRPTRDRRAAHGRATREPAAAAAAHVRRCADIHGECSGLDAPLLVERDRAMRDAFARAAGLGDPGELPVTTRPTRRAGESFVRGDFNLRHERGRGAEHLNPDSLRDAILSRAAALPSAPSNAGANG